MNGLLRRATLRHLLFVVLALTGMRFHIGPHREG